MSNEFYKFIVNQIQDFFITGTEINRGDRFYLQVDSREEVSNIISALNEKENIVNFEYIYNDQRSAFTMPMFTTENGLKVLIASTSDTVKAGFLAKLRNIVSLQEGVFKDTVLILISTNEEQLETISGGSTSLLKNDMPLNIEVVYKKLQTIIDQEGLDKTQAVILKDTLKQIYQEAALYHSNFLEFKSIYTTIQKKELGESFYKELGMFYDPDLITFKGKEVENRIAKNKELFSYVKKVHSEGAGKETLEKNSQVR